MRTFLILAAVAPLLHGEEEEEAATQALARRMSSCSSRHEG
jgi:hypothetical protein